MPYNTLKNRALVYAACRVDEAVNKPLDFFSIKDTKGEEACLKVVDLVRVGDVFHRGDVIVGLECFLDVFNCVPEVENEGALFAGINPVQAGQCLNSL